MKWPESLAALVDYGIVDEVVRPLMSGKEAEVFLVRCGDEARVAKVYKAAQERSFRQRADYTEGRRTRNSRDQRAVQKRTRHGREQDEAAWRVSEVERIHRLRGAGVRVPEPHEFVDGVLVMELVQDAQGRPAPRLGDVELSREEAVAIYDRLIREVVRMLAADLVHGDLSEFNVLLGADGPVIIDFPQSVDPAHNRNARTLLLRDVENLHRFVRRHAPGHRIRRLGEEMWQLYEKGKLEPDTALRGTYRAARGTTDTRAVMALIEDAKRDAGRGGRSDDSGDDATGSAAAPGGRRVVDFSNERGRARPSRGRSTQESKPRSGGGRRRGGSGARKASGANARAARTTGDPGAGRRSEPKATGGPSKPKAAGQRSEPKGPGRRPEPKAADGGSRRRRRGRREGSRARSDATPAKNDANAPASTSGPRPGGGRPRRRRRSRRPRPD